MNRGAAGVLALLPLAACQPNPRNEIPAIAAAALTEMTRTMPGTPVCVDAQVAPWQPTAEVRRIDTPAPPGFERLRTGRFRGGVVLKGKTVAGVRIAPDPTCFDLRGPLVDGDRAMIEVHLPGVGWNVWERRTDGDWRVVMTTTSEYPI